MKNLLTTLFGFDPKQHNVRTEILAGVTTFLTMAYMLALVPNILGVTGMDKGALFTTVIVSSVFATMVMAFYAKLPFVLGPGIGLSSFFAYTVCITLGYTWQFALTAVFIEGIIFILLTISNLREKIVRAIPEVIQKAIGAGIGLFLAFLGLQNAGIVVNHESTLVTAGNITEGSALLGLIGLIITGVLLVWKIQGGFLIGIIATTLIGIPLGVTQFEGIVDTPPSIEPIFMKFDFSQIFTKEMAVVVFTFLFIDMFDTIGTLVGVSRRAGLIKDGKMSKMKKAFMADALGTTAGAMLGSCTITTFVESSSGVGVGGRTGLTAFTAAMCFLLSLFLAPFFLAVPGAATAPVLILVGLMMLSAVKDIDFDNYTEAIPAFICILFMPATYSISEGIVLSVISYVLINLICGKRKNVSLATILLAVVFMLKYIM